MPPVNTYVCCTTEVHKRGTLQIHFTLRSFISYVLVPGIPWVSTKPPLCQVAVQFPLFLYLCEQPEKKSYSLDGRIEKYETTFYFNHIFICLRDLLTHISGDTVPVIFVFSVYKQHIL
jgi:hypothetical protein